MKQLAFFVLNITVGIALALITFILVFKATNYAYEYSYNVSVEASESKDEGSKEIEVIISNGLTTKEIAKILHENGLISNELVFRLQSALSKTDGTYKPGKYSLNTNMDDERIMKVLSTGYEANTDIRVTILEGYTTRQISVLLEREEIVKASDFVNALNNNIFNYDFIDKIPERNNRLEGYLFPDTYFFTKTSTENEIISKLLRRFEDVYNDELRTRANMLGLTMDDVIIMASIIEKEIKIPEEREILAGLIFNRLDKNMNLEMSSTLVYALNKSRDKLLTADKDVESPYNTYKHQGLPHGPICNPGEASIHAVLYPNKNDYLYFVPIDEETGEHFFTDDYDEFLDAKQEYNVKF